MQKMGEVPGPGSYNGGDLSTVAGSAVAKAAGVPVGAVGGISVREGPSRDQA